MSKEESPRPVGDDLVLPADWQGRPGWDAGTAACVDEDPDKRNSAKKPHQVYLARIACQECPVLTACFIDSVEKASLYPGVYGGHSLPERRQIKKNFPGKISSAKAIEFLNGKRQK